MPPELSALMQRYNQLGRLLPQGDEITRAVAFENVETRAEVTLTQPHQAIPRGSIPIAPAAPPLPHRPRFRALALFGRAASAG
jgi:hypothetical protein